MILETERVRLRPTIDNDLIPIFEILSNSTTMTFFVEGTYTLEQVQEMIANNQKEQKHYTMILKSSNEVIGKLSFHSWFMDKTYEIGWIMNPLFTNKGYATEASSKLIEYGFKTLDLHRIVATCQPENIPSKRLCEKLNMRLEGTFKKCIHVKGDLWWDELFYAILQEEYKKNNE